ncbi:DUF6268 family outer membrane beta-barrel protein [Shewanella woodyi]|uniref:DUF6268 family outer membrane beta-barrel protein n=1 Tax=Shewanella woodyi TaxID=60961 RepID=UPI00374816DF
MINRSINIYMKRAFVVSLLSSVIYVPSASASGKPSFSPFSVSVSRIDTAEADIGEGQNTLQRSSWLFDANAKLPLNKQWSLGFNLGYGDLNYDWKQDGSSILNRQLQGWQQVRRYSAGVSLSYRLDKHWMFMVAPKLQYAYADTAKSSNASSYGVVASGMYRFGNGNLLGLGVAYLNDISEVRTVPFLAVNWQINDSWRLGNPFAAGFTGPAGLELSYRLSPSVDFGFGASKRTQRFLLEDDDTTVEVDEWVSFLRAGWRVSESVTLTGYAGYYFNGELELNKPQVEVETIDAQGALAIAAEYRF